MRNIVIGLVTAILLAGCSSVGGGEDKFSAAYIRSHIIEHKTTQAEVQALYGVPDDQSADSDGSYDWTYQRTGSLTTASKLAGYVPGASSIANALNMTRDADSAASSASDASNKLTGNVEHHGNQLTIFFDKNKVVTHWYL